MKVLVGKACTTVLLIAASVSAFSEVQMKEPGAMLRDGTWSDGVGMYYVPQAFEKLKPSMWPKTGWSRLTIATDHIQIEPIAVLVH